MFLSVVYCCGRGYTLIEISGKITFFVVNWVEKIKHRDHVFQKVIGLATLAINKTRVLELLMLRDKK